MIDERHEVKHLLGRGGMADVFQATDTTTGRQVAIKLLRTVDLPSMGRHRSEIEVLSRLDHPGVVRLLGTGSHDGVPYLVLDLVDGPSLGHILGRGPLGVDRSISIGLQLAEALAGSCIGTAAYLAPEQLEGQIGPAADVYSLGLLLLECLTGTLCYPGTVAETTMARLHHSPDVPVDLPAWLCHTLQAMTSREPQHRPLAAALANAFSSRCVDPVLAPTAEANVVVLSPRAPPGGAQPQTSGRTGTVEHRGAITPPMSRRAVRRHLLFAFASGALTSAAALAFSLMIWPFGHDGAQATEPSTPIPSAPAVQANPPLSQRIQVTAAPTPAASPASSAETDKDHLAAHNSPTRNDTHQNDKRRGYSNGKDR